jgi:hypothetical protein
VSSGLRVADVTSLVSSYESEFSRISDENDFLRVENRRLRSTIAGPGTLQNALNDAYALIEKLHMWGDSPERMATFRERMARFITRAEPLITRKQGQ